MKLSLAEIQYNDRPLRWDFDPIANCAVCAIPNDAQPLFQSLFREEPGIVVKKGKLIIPNAREFFAQGTYQLQVDGDASLLPSVSSSGAAASSSSTGPLSLANQQLVLIRQSIKKNKATALNIGRYLRAQPPELLHELHTLCLRTDLSPSEQTVLLPFLTVPVLTDRLLNHLNQGEVGTALKDLQQQPESIREALFATLHHSNASDLREPLMGVMHQLDTSYLDTSEAIRQLTALQQQGVPTEALRVFARNLPHRVLARLQRLSLELERPNLLRDLKLDELLAQPKLSGMDMTNLANVQHSIDALYRMANDEVPDEEVITYMKTLQPDDGEMVVGLINQSEHLKHLGSGVLNRVVRRVSDEQWFAPRAASSSYHGSSAVFFAAPVEDTHLCLNSILNKKGQSEAERRQTFIHEDDEFLESSAALRERHLAYPVHSYESLNTDVVALGRNMSLYVVKARLIKSIRVLFDRNINPIYLSMPTSMRDDRLIPWCGKLAYDLMATNVLSYESEAEWRQRRQNLSNRLRVITSEARPPGVVPAELEDALQHLQSHVQASKPHHQSINRQQNLIEVCLQLCGTIDFDARQRSQALEKAINNGEVMVQDCRLFSSLIRANLKPSATDLSQRITRAVIVAITRCNTAFMAQLQASGLQPEDERYEYIIGQPSIRLNGFNGRLRHPDFYLGEPMLSQIEKALPNLIREHKKKWGRKMDEAPLTQSIVQLMTSQIVLILGQLFRDELQEAVACQNNQPEAPAELKPSI